MHVLVTGATGFVGGAVLSRLARSNHRVRILLRPTAESPDLPRGIPVEVGLASPGDRRGTQAALVGIEAVLHLAGGEGGGTRAEPGRSDVVQMQALSEAARQVGISRILFLSHLGADRSSAYPVLRAKAEAEETLRRSRVPFTIVRSALAYGPGDRLTTSLAMTLALSPGVYLLPGDGRSAVQPLHVEDLATALVWALEEDGLLGRTYEIGGPEVLPWREVVELVMRKARLPRILVDTSPPLLRLWLRLGETLLRRPPFSARLLDYLATGRTAPLDTLPRAFGLAPRRMQDSLEYLRGRSWGLAWARQQWGGRRR